MGLLAREIEACGVTTVGLALVKEVAEAAHAPRFLYLHWPFGHALGEPAASQGPRAPRRAQPGRRVLLVEDNEDNANAVSEFLRLRGYEVSVATSVAASVRAARNGFEVLVSDIGLPDGSGLELVRVLSREHPVRAIALSGYGTPADVQRSRDAGFQCHLTKPVDPDELVEAIEQAACEAMPPLAENVVAPLCT